MSHWTRLRGELYLDARIWGVGLMFHPGHVNYWFRFWLRPGLFSPHLGFLRRVWLWLNDCWGLGWDIRARWESEYFIRFFYLEVNIAFDAKEYYDATVKGG